MPRVQVPACEAGLRKALGAFVLCSSRTFCSSGPGVEAELGRHVSPDGRGLIVRAFLPWIHVKTTQLL